jgi:hypothetical protein
MKTRLLTKFIYMTLLVVAPGTVFAAYEMQVYWPLTVGNSYTWHEIHETQPGVDDIDIEVSSSVGTSETTGTQNIQGVSTFREDSTSPSQKAQDADDFESEIGGTSPPLSQDEDYVLLAWDSEGLKSYRDYDGRICSTPIVLLPAQMNLGETQTFAFYCGNDEDGHAGTITHTLEAVESVTVEAGTFDNCLKVRTVTSSDVFTTEHNRWLYPGVGAVKVIETGENEGQSYTITSTLRWASLTKNGDITPIGTGNQTWNGIETAYAVAYFNDNNEMTINDIYVGESHSSAHFILDIDKLIYEYDPSHMENGPFIPGLDLTGAYIRMNGGELHIYNIDYNGTKLWTKWTLVSDSAIGFQLTDLGVGK